MVGGTAESPQWKNCKHLFDFFCATSNSLSCRLFFMLRRFPIESTGRRKKLNEVSIPTVFKQFLFSLEQMA